MYMDIYLFYIYILCIHIYLYICYMHAPGVSGEFGEGRMTPIWEARRELIKAICLHAISSATTVTGVGFRV